MRKITKATAILILTASLTACSASEIPGGEHDYSSNQTNNSNTFSIRNAAIMPYDSDYYLTLPLPFALFGADNVQINRYEITSITGRNGEQISVKEVEDTDWNEIVCEDFAYLAERSSVLLNSIDNACLFDTDDLSFKDVPDYYDSEYRRYYAGDKLGSLTITSAKTTFSREGFNDKSGPLSSKQIKAEGIPFSSMLKRCDVTFDGEITMTGYIRVSVDEYGVGEGDVLFVPTGDCPLPVMNYYAERERDRVITPLWTRESHGLAYVSEYPEIRLGNIHKDADIGNIPADGTSTKVQVTVTDISMFCDTMMSSFINCKIVDIEKA